MPVVDDTDLPYCRPCWDQVPDWMRAKLPPVDAREPTAEVWRVELNGRVAFAYWLSRID